MKLLNRQALLEGFKDFLRTATLGLVSYLLTEGVLQALIVWLVGTRLDSVAIATITGLLTSILKGIDKGLHKKGVETPLDLGGLDPLIK